MSMQNFPACKGSKLTSPWNLNESYTLLISNQKGQRYSKRNSRMKSAIKTRAHTIRNFMQRKVLKRKKRILLKTLSSQTEIEAAEIENLTQRFLTRRDSDQLLKQVVNVSKRQTPCRPKHDSSYGSHQTCITQTCPGNILKYFTGVKKVISG